MRHAVFVATATSLVFLAMSHAALADERTYPHPMMWGGGWFMGPIMMLLVLAVVVAIVVLVVRWLWPGQSFGNSDTHLRSAMTILEERYARGEIDKEEFEEKKRVIGS
jgi:putative membrane protein